MHRFLPGIVGTGAGRALVLALLLALALTQGCAKKAPPEDPHYWGAPSVSLTEDPGTFVAHMRPAGQEMTSWQDLAPTLRKSLAYVNGKSPLAVAIERPDLTLTYGDMARTLRRLLELLPSLDKQPKLLLENFTWVPIGEGIMYSGYYEPWLTASRTFKPGYHPLYRRPPDMQQVRAKRKGKGYYTRKEIDGDGVLKGKGLELAWVKDIVDVFYLQIQGSGRLLFDDGTSIYVNYDGQNGHKYISSGKIMRRKGLLARGDIFEQRQWFKANPDRVWEILQENPSYVFFRFGTRGALGAIGAVVEEWKSLATSRSRIPLGAVVAYGVNIPDETHERIPLRGLGFAQDVGGAIKNNRIDIFCGGDARANYVASHLDAKGPAWVLLAR